MFKSWSPSAVGTWTQLLSLLSSLQRLSTSLPYLPPSCHVSPVIQYVTAIMPGNFGRRLYTNFWATTSPFFGLGQQTNRTLFFSDTANLNNFVHDFLIKQQFRRVSSLPPRRTTQITRRFASGGFFVLGLSPNSAAVETGTSCAISPEKIISHRSYQFDRNFFRGLSRTVSKRQLHTKDDGSKPKTQKDSISSENGESPMSHNSEQDARARVSMSKQAIKEQARGEPSNRHLMDRLPHMSQLHRPTKEELLAAANGFWSRLKVRFKWFSIRSVRPFNLDEITALFSWVLLGHVLWIVLGTTTFFSLLIFAINTVFAQGMFGLTCSTAPSTWLMLHRNSCRLDRQLSYKVFRCEGSI